MTHSAVQPEFVDSPKSLRDPLLRKAREAQIFDDHVAPLSGFVTAIRSDGHPDVPWFDPCDGGVQADCLFVLEAPGPKALCSGFVSWNNNDETAKNFFELSLLAGIDRKRTATWNIVPWYLGDASKTRRAKSADIQQGMAYLMRLIEILPELRVIALVGRAAARARQNISMTRPNLTIVEVPHPSPTFVNRSPRNRQAVLDGLLNVASVLNDRRPAECARHLNTTPTRSPNPAPRAPATCKP